MTVAVTVMVDAAFAPKGSGDASVQVYCDPPEQLPDPLGAGEDDTKVRPVGRQSTTTGLKASGAPAVFPAARVNTTVSPPVARGLSTVLTSVGFGLMTATVYVLSWDRLVLAGSTVVVLAKFAVLLMLVMDAAEPGTSPASTITPEAITEKTWSVPVVLL